MSEDKARAGYLTLSLISHSLRPILSYLTAAVLSPLDSRVVGRVALAITLLVLGACAPTASPAASTANAPIAVLGTENFYADLLAQIGGTRVIASRILNDPAADPHEYEASPATAKIVADPKLVIVNGLGYEDFIEKLLGASTKPDRVRSEEHTSELQSPCN